MIEGRIPPQALDIEMVVLGAMMIDGSRVHIAFEILNENDFYKPGNGKVFRAMQKLFESNSPIDSITVCDAISKAGSLDIVGGPVYLGECTSRASSAANLEHYCKVVLEKSLRRQMISASSAFSSESFDDTEEILDVIDRAQDKVLSIGGRYRHVRRCKLELPSLRQSTVCRKWQKVGSKLSARRLASEIWII